MVCGNVTDGESCGSFPSGKSLNASARLLVGMQGVSPDEAALIKALKGQVLAARQAR